ncbi:MAG: rhodanese-like domain-containing protein [Polaromonas sp.]|nr:rhodanese-like domain-containing protein [Polaromonas sp.]
MHIPISFDKIIEGWVGDFESTMNKYDISPGEDSGDVPCGIKIIFDGYGESESHESGKNKNLLSFAVFIHKDSMSGTFPEHDTQWGCVVHRPKEELCIYAWAHLDHKDGRVIEVLTDDLKFSSPVLERKLRRVVFDMYRREFYGDNKKTKAALAEFTKLDVNHQSVLQWLVEWREKGEKMEPSLDGVGFTAEASQLGERFTVSLPKEEFEGYPRGSNNVVVDTCEFGELKKTNIQSLIKQVTAQKTLTKTPKKKLSKKIVKELLDEASKRAEVIGRIQDRITARNQQYEVHFSPDVYKGPKASAELRASLEGLHKAAFEFLDDETVADFSLVFTPAVCDHAPSPLIPPESKDNYLSLGFNFSEIELVEMLAIPSGGVIGTKKNGAVGVYVSMTLNKEGGGYEEARKNAEADIKTRKRWQSSEESDELRIAIVRATRLLGLQIGYRAAKYSGRPMNMFVPTLVPDGSSTMLVQQNIDPSLNEATGDPSVKGSFSDGFFCTTDPVERKKRIVGYDDGKISNRTKKCTEFHRYLVSTSMLSIKGKEFADAPWIEIVDTPQEYNFDIYPASKVEMLQAVEGSAFVIDVRDAAEFAKNNIDGSVNIPYKGLDTNRYRISGNDTFDLSKLPDDRKSQLVVVGSGVEGDWNSYKASLACHRAGFKGVIWYPGRL